MMLLRSTLTPGSIELFSVERTGVETQFRIRAADFEEPEYADLLAEMQAVEAGAGYAVMTDPANPFPDTAAAPYTFDLTPWAAGTIVRITNRRGDFVDYSSATAMTLTDAGPYTLLVVPPLPSHTLLHELELTDA